MQQMLLGPLAGMYEKVILLFVDGYGWRFVERDRERFPFLARFFREGSVARLTSQFPSTTSVHTTTIHTGLSVGESGIYEWYMYEPSLGEVITSLPFSHAGDRDANTLGRDGVRPETIFPTTTIYQALSRMGVRSRVFQSRAFTPSPFTNVVTAGAQLHPFRSLAGGLRSLADAVRSDRGPGYYYLYSGNIDVAGHDSGPDSVAWDAQAMACFTALESILYAQLAGTPNTLLLMTADHGQIYGEPEDVIWIDELYPELGSWFQLSPRGKPIVPSGNFRDMVLHVQSERLEEVCEGLRHRLGDRALVITVEDLIAQGFFGKVTERFRERMGNLMVIPYGEELVWWHGYAAPHFRGYHGGLAPEEMETELLGLPLG